MYLYHVSYSWYEDFSPHILQHELAFSESEWHDILQRAYDAVISSLIEKEEKEETPRWIDGGDILPGVVDWLIAHYDFQLASFHQVHSLWGGSLFKKEDLKRLEQHKEEDGTPEFGNALPFVRPWLERIATHNQSIEDKDMEEMLKNKDSSS